MIYLRGIEVSAPCVPPVGRRLRLRPGGKQSPDCAPMNATPAVWRLQPAQDVDGVYAQLGMRDEHI